MRDPHFPPKIKPRLPKLSLGRRRAFHSLALVLLASGLCWLGVHFLAPDPDALASISAWSMKVHGAAAWLAAVLVGILWSSHIRLAWKLRINRLAGTAFAAIVALLILTGYGLYYFNGDILRKATEWLHWAAGSFAAVAFWLHRAQGRRHRSGQSPSK